MKVYNSSMVCVIAFDLSYANHEFAALMVSLPSMLVCSFLFLCFGNCFEQQYSLDAFPLFVLKFWFGRIAGKWLLTLWCSSFSCQYAEIILCMYF